MEIWRFINSPSKSQFLHLFIPLAIIIWPICNSQILTGMEGESIELDFPYSCHNFSRVTFRYGIRALSYDSANPTSVSLPPNQNLTIKDESQNNQCALHLTINPVSRNDEGTYILTGYDGNGQYAYDKRVGLQVDYPPGRASCESGDTYIGGEWIRLHCSAEVGNLAGQIICYQNGIRLPPWTELDETGGTLNQVIWARLEGMVYCCSSVLQQSIDMCKCKDVEWDPVLNTAITNVTDPCPVVLSSTQFPPIPQSPAEPEAPKITFPAMTKTIIHTSKEIENKNPLAPVVGVITVSLLLILGCLVLNAVLLFKFKHLEGLVKRFVGPKGHDSVELR